MIFEARSVVAAVDQGDLGGEPGQERGLLDGRVAAADDGDLLAPVEVRRRRWRRCSRRCRGKGPSMPSQRAEAPVATIRASAVYSRIVPLDGSPLGSSVVRTRNGRLREIGLEDGLPPGHRPRTAGPASASAPSARAPGSPRESPGNCRPTVVRVNCPPGSLPSKTRGARLARAAYSAAVRPAEPDPMMITAA